MHFQEKRLGRFRITPCAMTMFGTKMEDMLALMGNFVVVRAEYLYAEDAMDYVAWSPLFDIVAEGEEYPLYKITFTTRESGVDFDVERMK